VWENKHHPLHCIVEQDSFRSQGQADFSFTNLIVSGLNIYLVKREKIYEFEKFLQKHLDRILFETEDKDFSGEILEFRILPLNRKKATNKKCSR